MHIMAGQIYAGQQSSLNSAFHSYQGSTYYKCTNNPSSSCNTSALLVNYTSQSGGDGTMTNPYILNNCSIVSCACSWKEYVSNNTCIECPYGSISIQEANQIHTNTTCELCPNNTVKSKYSPAPSVYITKCEACPSNATCNGSTTFVCNYRYYKNGTGCTACPDSTHGLGTLVSSNKGATADTYDSGATSITECYIDGLSSYSETLFYDSTGKFYLTDECFYKN